MLKKIKAGFRWIWEHFWALAFWKRAIIASILGAMCGSTALAFFNRYALYYYAYRQGFRIPVEGVPYLDLAVSLLSFAFLSVSLFGAFGVYGFSTYIATSVGKSFNATNLHTITLIYLCFILTSIVSASGIALTNIVSIIFPDTLDILTLPVQYSATTSLSIATLFMLTTAFPKSLAIIKPCAILFTVVGTAIIIAALFKQSFYSSFLSNIGFGGGIPITVQYRSADNSTETQKGSLLISSNESMFIRDLDGLIIEIPRPRVSKITYTKVIQEEIKENSEEQIESQDEQSLERAIDKHN